MFKHLSFWRMFPLPQLIATDWDLLIKSIFQLNLPYRQDNYIYVVKIHHNHGFMTKMVTLKIKYFFVKISLHKLFFRTKCSLAPKTKTIFDFLSVSCKSWRPQHSRTPWHYKCINEFMEILLSEFRQCSFTAP